MSIRTPFSAKYASIRVIPIAGHELKVSVTEGDAYLMIFELSMRNVGSITPENASSFNSLIKSNFLFFLDLLSSRGVLVPSRR